VWRRSRQGFYPKPHKEILPHNYIEVGKKKIERVRRGKEKWLGRLIGGESKPSSVPGKTPQRDGGGLRGARSVIPAQKTSPRVKEKTPHKQHKKPNPHRRLEKEFYRAGTRKRGESEEQPISKKENHTGWRCRLKLSEDEEYTHPKRGGDHGGKRKFPSHASIGSRGGRRGIIQSRRWGGLLENS